VKVSRISGIFFRNTWGYTKIATLEQIKDFDTAPLDDIERELVRQILNITGKAGTATYIESEVRMNLLTSAQNQVVRGLLLDYDAISFDTTFVVGGSSGANYNPQRDKEKIAFELRRMLYPNMTNEITEEVAQNNLFAIGKIVAIPVTYKVGSKEMS
jgi:hypothetical protein